MDERVRTYDAPVVNVPVHGTWKLIEGPGRDRFAFDLVTVASDLGRAWGRSRPGGILGNDDGGDSYGESLPVYAPITGTVVRADDRSPDRQRFSLLRDAWSTVSARSSPEPGDIVPFAVNYVIIQGACSHALLTHIQRRSLQVTDGDEVDAGQVMARVASSGTALGPHVHFQLLDQIDPLEGGLAALGAITSGVIELLRVGGTKAALRARRQDERGDRIRRSQERTQR